MTTHITTSEEVLDFFRAAYTEELSRRLTQAAYDDELDDLIDGDMIEGSVLTGCDEAAYSAAQQNFAWRIGDKEISEIFTEAGADVYDPIDYAAIISQARNA